MRHRAGLLVIAVPLAFAATGAGADVTVSSDPTSNITCSSGVCAPTATNAVLNVGDLETMLATGNVEVTTTGSGVQANNIDIGAKLSWSGANALALEAYDSIAVAAKVSVKGAGGLALTTNDGGSGGTLSFGAKGNVTLRHLSSQLVINGATYTLVNSVQTLASAITANPNGDYALAGSYDASGLTQYSPANSLAGTVEGLGNTISNLTVRSGGSAGGLVREIEASGGVENLTIASLQLSARTKHTASDFVGGLASFNFGMLFDDRVTGTIAASGVAFVGGLVSINYGTIARSFSNAKAQAETHPAAMGGLVSENKGSIAGSYASGSVTGGGLGYAGGLVGANGGSISNSYATGSATGAWGDAGGLIGWNDNSNNTAFVNSSYSTGQPGQAEDAGGFIGLNSGSASGLTDCDWDTTTSGTDTGIGHGPHGGLTGLTTQQFQSGLPAGFDPAIWAENPEINGGLPYLIANPPVKK